MIRMVLLALGFLAITIALIAFQPGMRQSAVPEPPEFTVSRAEPAPLDTLLAAAPDPAPVSASEPRPPTPPAPAAAPAAQPADDANALRRMTWQALAGLQAATGQSAAPGKPGSLLATIVTRSLTDLGLMPTAAPEGPSDPDLYVVQPGDSLASIALAVYGDVNMTGPLFAANQSQLAHPDDLRPGQRLILPES
ncbi:LysM peptidoglycan-binding domain-containing protein [Salipiger abyssi]|uniref:LysM peptidoglycan-binding domain-containing protein n=1 Tax=Salipiger abyssi TaxID=1250539 RepID=UPI00405979DA